MPIKWRRFQIIFTKFDQWFFVGTGFSRDALRWVAKKASWLKPFPTKSLVPASTRAIGSGLPKWQAHEEFRSTAFALSGAHAAAMFFGDFLDHRETEPGAT